MDGRKGFGFFVGLQVVLLISWIARVRCQEGFLSIDCGSSTNYTDNEGLSWETDDKYISTGKNEKNVTYPSRYDGKEVLNGKQVETLRYFDEGRGRDCYVLPVKPQYTYLLRPTFFYGNWSRGGRSNFRVYVNGTFWKTIAYDSGKVPTSPQRLKVSISINRKPLRGICPEKSASVTPIMSVYEVKDLRMYQAHEAIVYSTGTELNFCLVKVFGTPVIAALELRLLTRGMYSTVVGTDTFLSLYGSLRMNPGAPLDGPPYLRYPDDPYDRIWYAGGPYENASLITRTGISTSNALAPNQPPTKVMEDAWIDYGVNGSSIVYYQDINGDEPVRDLRFQIYGYFQELDGNASDSNVRGMDYIFNDDIVNPINTTDKPLQKESTFAISHKHLINVTLVRASWSKLDIMINAFEIYSISDVNNSATALEDLNVVVGLQRRFNLTDWTGDPCFPIPYDWVKCVFDPGDPTIGKVSELFLANASTSMMGTSVPPEISNLKALTYLNVSSNELTDFPTNLKELNLTVLDVSNNRLNGSISNFLDVVNLGTLQEIHAADNQFEGEFRLDSLVQQRHVKIGNFNRNLNINGYLDLSEWHASLLAALQVESPTLQLFSLVDNNITDIFPKLSAMERTIEAVLNLKNGIGLDTGILLGGNPYCEQSKSTSLAQRYLCRFSTGRNDTLFQTSRSNSNEQTLVIIAAAFIGGFFGLVSCVCLRILWKLRKQTYALLEIQEDLAKQQVQPPFYLYNDLRTGTRNFSPDNLLGEGAFGSVYKSVGLDGTVLAVKKLKLTKQVMREFLNEVVLITGIKHKNLVQLKGCCVQEKQRILVYEYVENGNLAEALWGEGTKLDWKNRFNICLGVARGLSYLHEELQPRIIHRDIKPPNILIDKNLNAKIADFGLARPFMDDQSRAVVSHRAGTVGYFAPEYASQGQLTEKADVFSFGVLVLEMVSGRRCIDHDLPREKMYLINLAKKLMKEGRLLDLLEPALREGSSDDIDGEVTRVVKVALLCLQTEPTTRPAMSDVVTMLQGSMDVTVFVDIPICHELTFKGLSGNAPTSLSENPPSKFNYDRTETPSDRKVLLNIDDSFSSSKSIHRGGGTLQTTNVSGR